MRYWIGILLCLFAVGSPAWAENKITARLDAIDDSHQGKVEFAFTGEDNQAYRLYICTDRDDTSCGDKATRSFPKALLDAKNIGKWFIMYPSDDASIPEKANISTPITIKANVVYLLPPRNEKTIRARLDRIDGPRWGGVVEYEFSGEDKQTYFLYSCAALDDTSCDDLAMEDKADPQGLLVDKNIGKWFLIHSLYNEEVPPGEFNLSRYINVRAESVQLAPRKTSGKTKPRKQ